MAGYQQRIFAGLFGLVLAGGLGETLCRLFPTWHDAFVKDIVYSRLPADLYRPVGGFAPGERPGKVRYEHAPNAQVHFKGLEYDNWVYTDERGFRTSPEVVEVNSDREVLLLGDSFLFGAQVSWSASFVGQLQQQNPMLQLLNAGVDGYSTEDALALWAALPFEQPPDEIWLFFFWGNDIWENDWRSREQMHLIPIEGEENAWERNGWLNVVRHSAFASRLYALWAIKTDERFAERQQQRRMLQDSEWLSEALQRTQVQLQTFADVCPTTCRVVLIPPADAFEEPLQAETTLPLLQSVIPNSLSILDLYQPLQDRGGRSLYFHADPHWNVAGHQAVAEIIQAEFLAGQ